MPSRRLRADGRAVEWRAGAVTERVDVRRDAVELSYVFAAPPAGSGDLVVRATYW